MIIYYILVLLLVIYYLNRKSSSFENIIYQQPTNCGTSQGHLPGSDIILTDAERRVLLQKFVNNSI
jgi:hypothetical protein